MIYWLFKTFKRDSEGLYNGKILPFSHYKYFYFFSCLGLLTPLYLFYYNCMLFGILSSFVSYTCINYWRNPIPGWTRNLDMAYMRIILLHNIICGLFIEPKIKFFSVIFSGILSYILGVLFYDMNMLNISSLFHGIVHVLGHISSYMIFIHFYFKFEKNKF